MPTLQQPNPMFSTATSKILKTFMLSTAVITTLVMVGCASKPNISSSNNNRTRVLTAPEYYTVQSGDTLSGIAARYGLNYLNVANINSIGQPYTIYVGQSLRLKGSATQRTTVTQPIAQTAPIQRQSINLPSTTTQNTTQVTQQTKQTYVPAVTPSQVNTVAASNSLQWTKPSQNAIIQRFNSAANVKGLRYGGRVGDPIYAAANGQVVYASDGLKEYGNLVLIKHVDGYITAYAHNNKLLVKSGDNVKAGQKIAEMGSSGTNQVMLEFQIRLNGKPIDPLTIIQTN